MLNRRDSLKLMASGLGAAFLPGVTRGASLPGVGAAGGPKRVIFFMQNQGFDPQTCIPTGVQNGGSLAKAVLPERLRHSIRSRFHRSVQASGRFALSSDEETSLATLYADELDRLQATYHVDTGALWNLPPPRSGSRPPAEQSPEGRQSA